MWYTPYPYRQKGWLPVARREFVESRSMLRRVNNVISGTPLLSGEAKRAKRGQARAEPRRHMTMTGRSWSWHDQPALDPVMVMTKSDEIGHL